MRIKRTKGYTSYIDDNGNTLTIACTKKEGELFFRVAEKLEDLKNDLSKTKKAISENKLFVINWDGSLMTGIYADTLEDARRYVMNKSDNSVNENTFIKPYEGEDIKSVEIPGLNAGWHFTWNISGHIFNPYFYRDNLEASRKILTEILEKNINTIREYTGFTKPLYMKAIWE